MVIKKIVLTLVFLIFANFIFGDAKRENIKKVFPVNGKARLLFTDIDGGVTIKSHSKNEIVMDFKKELDRRDSSSPKKLDYFEAIKPVYETENGDIKIKVKYPRKKGGIFSSFFSIKVKIHTTLTVPENIVVKIKLVDGSIRGVKLNNPLFLRTVDGSIKVMESSGSLNSSTTDGSLYAEGFKGSVSHSTVDGSIKVKGVLKEVNLTTVDGSITVDFQEGSNLTGNSKLKTVDGSIRVQTSETMNFNLLASSVDGGVYVNKEIFDSVEKSSRRSIKASMKDAQFQLYLKTVDGSIRVNKK